MERDAIAEPRSSEGALAPPLPGEVHVWRISLPDADPRGAARAARDRLLGAYLGISEPPVLELADGGKPRLAGTPAPLSFNLSHSGGLALLAVAVAGTEVGVDVERIRPRRDLPRLAARWLPADDARAVAAAAPGEREAVFYAAWTRHEARVKCAGVGLAGPSPGPEVRAWPLPVDAGYAAAVALVAAAEPRIVLRDAPGRE